MGINHAAVSRGIENNKHSLHFAYIAIYADAYNGINLREIVGTVAIIAVYTYSLVESVQTRVHKKCANRISARNCALK